MSTGAPIIFIWGVALRKESVDRNKFKLKVCPPGGRSLSARRAWIEIISVRGHGFWPRWSLSARRAWIEIVDVVSVQHGCESLSARRAWIEIVSGVDDTSRYRSLSARRAWIEISFQPDRGRPAQVALRKESVDRNRALQWLLYIAE